MGNYKRTRQLREANDETEKILNNRRESEQKCQNSHHPQIPRTRTQTQQNTPLKPGQGIKAEARERGERGERERDGDGDGEGWWRMKEALGTWLRG